MMMKTIEERATSAWNEYEYREGNLYRICFCDGYEQGAKDEHKLLTEWHDPKKELPDTNRDVLIKTTMVAKYQIAFYKADAQRNYHWHENNGAIDDDMVVGWREIHDLCPLETYKEIEEDDESINTKPATIILDALPHLEWAAGNLAGHGGTEVDGRWYYTWDEAMVAAAELGDGWRLPTIEELVNLRDLGSTWDAKKMGRLFGGKLFLSAAGYLDRDSGVVAAVGETGHCWSSSPYSSGVNAGNLGFYSGGVCPVGSNSRAYGFSVRCVREIK